MTVLEIITPEVPLLRQKAKPVDKFDDELQSLIDDMIETMRSANGVGLAAPQINKSIRMAVIETLPEEDEEGEPIEGSRKLFVIVNPEITWYSRKKIPGIEGCLSIPGYLGEVDRAESIRVKGLDRNGKKLDMRLKGWTARIFQHEIDHLDGVLFIDKLTAEENFWREEEYYSMQEELDEDE